MIRDLVIAIAVSILAAIVAFLALLFIACCLVMTPGKR